MAEPRSLARSDYFGQRAGKTQALTYLMREEESKSPPSITLLFMTPNTLKQTCRVIVCLGAICVQRFDDSRISAIRITYRIWLRSSSLSEPRYPPLKIYNKFLIFLIQHTCARIHTYIQTEQWTVFLFFFKSLIFFFFSMFDERERERERESCWSGLGGCCAHGLGCRTVWVVVLVAVWSVVWRGGWFVRVLVPLEVVLSLVILTTPIPLVRSAGFYTIRRIPLVWWLVPSPIPLVRSAGFYTIRRIPLAWWWLSEF